MKRKVLHTLLAVTMAFGSGAPVYAQSVKPDRLAARPLPASLATLKLDAPATAAGFSRNVLDSSLRGATGSNRVIIRLSADSGAAAFVKGADTAQAKRTAKAQQDAFLASARALDPNARVVAQVQAVLNAVFVEVDASVLPALARDPRVVRIAPVGNYELDLAETVPYIGATAVQAKGVDGKGIKVAVLDSGIDYLHAALGGSGSAAEFAANNPDVIEPGTFPTAKVVGGYDFIGVKLAQHSRGAGSGSAGRRGSAAVTEPTLLTSSPARAASHRAPACMPSRSARRCRPPAPASR